MGLRMGGAGLRRPSAGGRGGWGSRSATRPSRRCAEEGAERERERERERVGGGGGGGRKRDIERDKGAERGSSSARGMHRASWERGCTGWLVLRGCWVRPC